MLTRCLHNPFALTLLLVVCNGCGQGNALNRALQSAGSNRTELEAVLSHYQKTDPNPDKLRAAGFLTENMPALTTYNKWLKADLLAIDDIMLFPVKKEESASFFNLINSLHEKTSVIITTNKAPTEWAQTLSDEVLATAIIDRLLYRCEVIKLAGTSYRLENRKTIFTPESTVNGKQLRKDASTTIQTQE